MSDIDFITSSNDQLKDLLTGLGCDLETLKIISTELLDICDELDYTSRESADFIIRLKHAMDTSSGK